MIVKKSFFSFFVLIAVARMLLVMSFIIHKQECFAQDDIEEEEEIGTSAVDKFSSESPTMEAELADTFKEKIEKISSSKNILLITNNAQKLKQGDFLSFVYPEGIILRALVAKTDNEVVAIKILRIHSLQKWQNLFPGSQVDIIQGDDSYFLNRKKQAASKQTSDEVEEVKASKEGNIITEDDLFNITEDQDGSSEKDGRSIRPDNVISVAFGQKASINETGENQRYPMWGASWSYQPIDNFFAEFSYGQMTMKSFPSEDLDTRVTTYTFRGKYTFAGPLMLYFMPYVGFEMIKASSPNAGVQKGDNSSSNAQLKREIELVEQVQENKLIFGLSLYKRLVPGWFVKADVGTDIFNLGIALEF
jgi:hypothetical protein